MPRKLVREIQPHVNLYQDTKTGIAWVENGRAGIGHSAHPNISETGSVRGMKEQGYWDKNARTVESHGWIYNTDVLIVSDELDEIARQHCQCGGTH
jgi:hypothetical protein